MMTHYDGSLILACYTAVGIFLSYTNSRALVYQNVETRISLSDVKTCRGDVLAPRHTSLVRIFFMAGQVFENTYYDDKNNKDEWETGKLPQQEINIRSHGKQGQEALESSAEHHTIFLTGIQQHGVQSSLMKSIIFPFEGITFSSSSPCRQKTRDFPREIHHHHHCPATYWSDRAPNTSRQS